jgi:hypothetical protein
LDESFLSFALHTGRTQCWIELLPWQWKLYISIVATTVFVVPAIIISGCYTIIVYTIWSKSKLLSPAKSNAVQRGTKSNIIIVRTFTYYTVYRSTAAVFKLGVGIRLKKKIKNMTEKTSLNNLFVCRANIFLESTVNHVL